jgi:hypothetical protein
MVGNRVKKLIEEMIKMKIEEYKAKARHQLETDLDEIIFGKKGAVTTVSGAFLLHFYL